MKIMVIGGSGYIGSVLIPSLVNAGDVVDSIDIKPSVNTGYIHDEFIYDISKNLPSLGSYHVLIYLATAFDGVNAWKVNYDNLISVTNKIKALKLIYISSCGVNNSEDKSAYTESKRNAEAYIQSKSDNYCIVRLASVYGVAPIMNYVGLVNSLVKDAVISNKLTIIGAQEMRPIVNVKDAVYHIIASIRDSENIKDIATANYTKGQLANEIIKSLPIKIKLQSSNSEKTGYTVHPLVYTNDGLHNEIIRMAGVIEHEFAVL